MIFLQTAHLDFRFCSERIPFALASAARTVVIIGIFPATAALRMTTSCSRGIFPLGVLMMELMSRVAMISKTDIDYSLAVSFS
jgi:hypothetical protein